MKLLLSALLLTLISICEAQKKTPDFLAANINTSVLPSTNFFEYANGGWIKKTPIPAGEGGWGIGNLVQEEIYNRILAINKQASIAKAAKGTSTQKIGDFWLSAMDTVTIYKKGLSALANVFTIIDKVTTLNQLSTISAKLQQIGISNLFGMYAGQDDKNSEAIIISLYQGGLGLPNREYYYKTDVRTLKVRQAYKTYLTQTLQQLNAYYKAKPTSNISLQSSMVANIYNFEKSLAAASKKLEDLRDPYANYNKSTFALLQASMQGFNWKNYTTALDIDKFYNDSINVAQPEFYKALSATLTSTPLATIKAYLKVRSIQAYAGYLDNKTYANLFAYRKTLSGATSPRPRYKRMLDAQEDAMGELLGQLFAKAYFNETAKARYSNLVEEIRNAYAIRIKALPWMSDVTKQKALEKLSKVTKKVGYPDVWKDFSSLTIYPNALVENMMNANNYWFNRNTAKLGKPVDRTEWDMTPQTYNAYYNPSNNEIVLPAGIFAVPNQADADLDDAFVYGYAGASTIGHEITHGFDDQGRQYDAQGNLADWWTKADGEQYIKRAKAIIQQYNEFVPVDTLHVNGDATQGENIADLGGMLLGLDAFKLTKQYKEGKLIGGLTPTQRYFLGYAYGWMYQEKKERLANQVMTDVHAPAKERVNGPVVNIPEFYQAFNIKPTDAMYRAEAKRVSIW